MLVTSVESGNDHDDLLVSFVLEECGTILASLMEATDDGRHIGLEIKYYTDVSKFSC